MICQRMNICYPLHDIKGLLIVHTSENNVLVIQPGGLDRGDEELGAVDHTIVFIVCRDSELNPEIVCEYSK